MKTDEAGRGTVAVIIPVYNSEATLAHCIASVAAQRHKELEIVVVDDGSRDGSARICDEWAERDRRVTVVHQPNRGRSAARAAGVEASRAEWICFVDSDDALPASAVADLYAAATPDVDIVLGNGHLLGGESRRQIPMPEFRHMAVRAEGNIGVPWGSLYRRSAVTPYTLDLPRALCMGEDYIFWLRLVFGTERPVNVVYEEVYEKGADTTSSRFVWDVDYAAEIDRLRLAAIPESERAAYLADSVADRLVNLVGVALHSRKSEWKTSRFYAALKADVVRSGFRVPTGTKLYLSLPARWMRKLYSKLSDMKRRIQG